MRWGTPERITPFHLSWVIQIHRHHSNAWENFVTATALVPVERLPAAARIVVDALSAWIAETSEPFDEVGFPIAVWCAEQLPEIEDDVLNRLDRAAVRQLLGECCLGLRNLPDFAETIDPHFAEMVDRAVMPPAGRQATRIRDVARMKRGVLWLDENGRVRFFTQLALDDADIRYLDDSLLLLAALGWVASRTRLHPSKAPVLFQPLSSIRVRMRMLTLLDRDGVDTVLQRVCPDLSGTERAQLHAALLGA